MDNPYPPTNPLHLQDVNDENHITLNEVAASINFDHTVKVRRFEQMMPIDNGVIVQAGAVKRAVSFEIFFLDVIICFTNFCRDWMLIAAKMAILLPI
jgi:hypothetical protein